MLLSSSSPGRGHHLSHSGQQRAQLAGLYSPGEQVHTLVNTLASSCTVRMTLTVNFHDPDQDEGEMLKSYFIQQILDRT